MSNALVATVRIFAVILANMGSVAAALAKLNKRAARKGLPLLSYSWGKPYTEVSTGFFDSAEDAPAGSRHVGGREYRLDVTRIPLTLENGIQMFQGWTFVAALQHLEGENIVRALPGATIPEVFRSRGSACDHCKINRRRIDTYVVRHEDGRHVQVGSTCIADFLGSDDAGKIADAATMLAEASSIGEGGESGEGGGTSDYTLTEMLAWVSCLMREDGWVSRTASRDGKGTATADTALFLMSDRKAREKWVSAHGLPSEADHARAEEGATWAESLTYETVNAETGDYLHNIRAIARSGLVTYRTGGLGGSILVAFDRAMGRARLAKERTMHPTCNEYLGTVGTKVSFGLPALTDKKGNLKKGAPIVLTSDPLTLDFVTGFESEYGYTTILSFRTSLGHSVVWMTSSTEVERKDVGKKYTVSGTVKAHRDYKGTAQTLLTRCAVTEVKDASVDSQAA